jgi:FkbM family methyltransferase
MITLLGRLAATARRVGLGRALRSVRDTADRLFVLLNRPPLRVTVDGIELRGFLRHRSFLGELADEYEPLVRRSFAHAVADADVVLDVGSHTGFYALLAARLRPEARIVAVEADPYNAAALRVNVRGTAIEVVQKAASDGGGRATFRQNLGTIGSSLVERPGTGPARTICVETIALDDLADGEGRRVVLKLDVEGVEARVLTGAERLLGGAAAATVIAELNPRALAAAGSSPAEVVAALERLSLVPRFVDEEKGALTDAIPLERKGNVVAS